MKKLLTAFSILIFAFLPGLLFSLFDKPLLIHDTQITAQQNQPQSSVVIHVKTGNSVEEMELESYICGVVLGEMPSEFETDALRAQSVASRTYTLRKAIKNTKHMDADICTDPSCCQAFVDSDTYLMNTGSATDLEKVRQAVLDTSGQVLTYGNDLIEATYFSSSGGKTEDAVAVWGTDVPYLRSVDSPGEDSSVSEKKIVFVKSDVVSKLGLSKGTELSQDTIKFQYTSGGGVKKMTVGSDSFDGVQLRTLLGLPSTVFSLQFTEDTVIFITKGNGHRVGMSQYGADAMAVAGKSYTDILAHYYPGTQLVSYTPEEMASLFDKEDNL